MPSSTLHRIFPTLDVSCEPISEAMNFSNFSYQPTSVACQVKIGHYSQESHVNIYRLQNGLIQEICKPKQATMTLTLVEVPTSTLKMDYFSAFVAAHVLGSIKAAPSPSQQIFFRGSSSAEIEAIRRAFLCLVPSSALSFRTNTPNFFQTPPTRNSPPSPLLQSLMQEVKQALAFSQPKEIYTRQPLGMFG